MFARILALLFTTTFLLLTSPVLAASSTTIAKPLPATPAAVTTSLPAYIPPTSPLYTDLLVNNLFHSFSCLAIGQSFIGQPCLTYQITKNAQGMLQGIPVLSQVNTSGGVLGATTNLIGMLYQNPPIRTADYLASVGQDLGIVKEAHAQVVGSGEAVLHPILTLWQVSRNISYIIMIIIFVVIGLMIMFRNKINPQTVITAQAALPGLVIGLIMITFSYFFAGLISDVAFIGTNVVGYYFSAVTGKTNPPLLDDMKSQNVLKVMSPFTGLIDRSTAANVLSGVWDSLSESAQQLLTMLGVFITVQTTGQATEGLKAIPVIGAPAQAIVTIIAATGALANPTAVIGIALAFVATAILMYAMLKLLLRLINAYLTIIVLTVTAPFQLLAASLPGRQGITTSWILNMLANILAFPAVLAVLYFVAFLVPRQFINDHHLNPPFRVSSLNQTPDSSTKGTVYAQGSDVKITDTTSFPLFGGFDLSFLNIILAFGALMALPSIPDVIGRTIGRLGVVGQVIGQEISGNLGQGQNYTRQFQQGVGSIGGQVAQGRGLFPTTEYTATVDGNGRTIYTKSPYLSRIGGLQKPFAWWRNRKGQNLP